MNSFNLLYITLRRYGLYLFISIVLCAAAPIAVYAADADDPFYEKQEYLKVIQASPSLSNGSSSSCIISSILSFGSKQPSINQALSNFSKSQASRALACKQASKFECKRKHCTIYFQPDIDSKCDVF